MLRFFSSYYGQCKVKISFATRLTRLTAHRLNKPILTQRLLEKNQAEAGSAETESAAA